MQVLKSRRFYLLVSPVNTGASECVLYVSKAFGISGEHIPGSLTSLIVHNLALKNLVYSTLIRSPLQFSRLSFRDIVSGHPLQADGTWKRAGFKTRSYIFYYSVGTYLQVRPFFP